MTHITYERKTELVEEVVKESRRKGDMMIAEFKAEGGGFLGDKKLAPNPRLEAYWQSITLPDGNINWHDLALIMDPGTEVKLRTGVDTDGPQMPTWINFLRIPDMFTEKARDFVRLNEIDQERQQREGPDEIPSTPVTSGAGLPPPQMAAPVAPQPPAGGGAAGYGNPGPGMMQ